jgi:hypothetical protein
VKWRETALHEESDQLQVERGGEVDGAEPALERKVVLSRQNGRG